MVTTALFACQGEPCPLSYSCSRGAGIIGEELFGEGEMVQQMQLKALFEPITIAGIEIRNRIKMGPMALGYARDGYADETFKNFYVERAKGGFGLIDWPLWPYRVEHGYFPYVWDDRFIPGLREVVRAVHSYGAKIIAQLGTGYGWSFKNGPCEIVGPSGISLIARPGTPFRVGTPTAATRLKERPLTVAEIREMVEGYGDAARRIREAEFDGVEIMAGAGYTISRFISPLTNKRDDEYGGPLENRMRLFREIVENIKKKAGPDFPIFCKISGSQFIEGGYTLEECANEIVPMMAEMGVCCVDVVVGWHEAPRAMLTNSVPEGGYLYLAEEVKKRVNIPICGGARVTDVTIAEEAIARGRIDMIVFSRPSLADPELPRKAAEGRLADIRPCICCSHCLEAVDSPVICSVNPRAGKEGEYVIEPARRPKKVFIIGGGPAGMQAALTAAERGHQVTLFERSDRLGGQLHAAAAAPFKELIGKFKDYLARQVEKNGITVKLNTEATLETIKEGEPDAVIVATGATPIIPNIPGVLRAKVVTAVDVLLGRKKTGDEVVVIGGGMVGCEVAEHLARQGKRVTVLEMLERMAPDVPRAIRFDLMMRLRQLGVTLENNVRVTEITEHGVWGKREPSPTPSPNDVFFPADTVVLAVGFKPNRELAEELGGKGLPVYNIGDAEKPQRIREAILSGFLTARQL